MFTIILYGFGMICMELTGLALFSAELPWCCFLCRNESFPNELKLFDDFFGTKETPKSFVGGPEEPRGGHNPPGRAWWARHAPVGCAHLEAHLRVKPTPKNPINRETIKNKPRSEVPPPQASVATENQSRPCSGTLPKGESSPMAIFIIPAATTMRRE